MKNIGFLFPAIIMCILSWFKYANTGSIQVDDNFFKSDWAIYLNYGFTLIAILLSFFQFFKLYNSEVSDAEVRRLNYLLVIVCFFTLPMYSSDIFSILSYGRDTLNDVNVFQNYALSAESIYYPFVYKMYHSVPCVYGPVNLWVSKVCQFSDSVFVNLICIKLIYLLFHFIMIKLLEELSNHETKVLNKRNIKYLSLFPLVWFQGFMQLHNDVLGLVFALLAAYYLFTRKKLLASLIFMVLAFTIKFTFAALFGVYAFAWYNLNYKWNFKTIFGSVLIASILLSILYIPFVESFSDIYNPLLSLKQLGTHGSIKDVLNSIGQVLQFQCLEQVFNGILLLIFLYVLYSHMIRSKENNFLVLSLIVTCVFITMFSHRFFPWYLILLTFFYVFQIKNSQPWNKWLFFISLFYCLQDLSVQIPHNYLLFHVNVGLSTFLGIVSIFLFLRKRFDYN